MRQTEKNVSKEEPIKDTYATQKITDTLLNLLKKLSLIHI